MTTMTTDAAHSFWVNDHRYQSLAKRFEQGITINEPDWVTSRRMCPCLKYTRRCGFPLNGKVTYLEYRGESI